MERIGIYGGTFNPPHLGHFRAAQYALSQQLDKLLVIPSCISPHKQLPEGSATPEQRLEMLRLGLSGIDHLEISDLELRRGGASYTFETVAQIKTMYPKAELILFMGTDMFLSFHTWKNPAQIMEKASLAVFYRGQKDEKAAVAKQMEFLRDKGATVYLVENPVLEISSTDLRRMLTFQCADEFLAPEVAEYIRKNRLYGTGRALIGLSASELETVVTGLVKPGRIPHILGCRDTAVALAKVWGADETDAARAGLLHDITKALDGPLQLTLCNAYGTILDNFSTHNPKTLHALTGALVAQKVFGENSAVVSAIRSHTTGKADMNMLEKIIYVADYMEPNRDFSGVEKMRELAYTNIDSALRLGLEMTLDLLREQGREISPESQQALAFLKG